MFRLKRDWITLTAFIIVAGAGGYWVYSEWAGPRFEEGLRRNPSAIPRGSPLRDKTLRDWSRSTRPSSHWSRMLT